MSNLRAAAGGVDLSPPAGIWLTGFAGRPGPSTSLHDPIKTRAVVVSDGVTDLAVLSCDLLGLSASASAEIRLRIAARTGIPADNVLVCCTHTHNGPASGVCRACMGYDDHSWLGKAKDKMVGLIDSLQQSLVPVTMKVGNKRIEGISHNRQDGSHSVDDELVAVVFESIEGPVATVINFALHPVILGGGNRSLSAEFPGAAVARIEERFGGTALFIQGASGDINPLLSGHDNAEWSAFKDVDEIAERLAAATTEALAAAAYTEPAEQPSIGPGIQTRLSAAKKSIELPLTPLPSLKQIENLIYSCELERKKAKADGREIPCDVECEEQLAAEMLVAKRSGKHFKTLNVEIFAFAFGGTLLVAVPFEPYSAIGLAVKKALMPATTIFAGYANGLNGYLCTDQAIIQGGYGPEHSAKWFSALLTPPAKGAADIVISECIKMAGIF